jgi:hypothetical protein
MKKMILSVAAIGVTFVAFAFAPVEKNNAMNNTITSDFTSVAGTCDSRYQTSEGFTVCDRVFKEDELEIAGLQREVLNKY